MSDENDEETDLVRIVLIILCGIAVLAVISIMWTIVTPSYHVSGVEETTHVSTVTEVDHLWSFVSTKYTIQFEDPAREYAEIVVATDEESVRYYPRAVSFTGINMTVSDPSVEARIQYVAESGEVVAVDQLQFKEETLL